MNETSKTKVVFKRILAIVLLVLMGMLTAYMVHSCRKVSINNVSLDDLVGITFRDFKATRSITFATSSEMDYQDQEKSLILDIEKKSNCIYATDEEVKYVFIIMAKNNIFFQNKNISLYSEEYINELVAKEAAKEAESEE